MRSSEGARRVLAIGAEYNIFAALANRPLIIPPSTAQKTVLGGVQFAPKPSDALLNGHINPNSERRKLNLQFPPPH